MQAIASAGRDHRGLAEADADAIPKEKKAKAASQPFQCSKYPFGCKNIGAMSMHKKHKHPEPIATKAAGAGSAMAKLVANARLQADINGGTVIQ